VWSIRVSCYRSIAVSTSVVRGAVPDTGKCVQLYRTDGTHVGTNVLLDLPPATSIYGVALTPQYLYFKTALRTSSNSFSDFRLWRSDGTAAGTLPVVDLPSVATSNDNGMPIGPMSVDDRMFFIINTQATGRELWVSDGTEAGTRVVKNFGRVPAGLSIPVLGYILDYNGTVFMSGWDTTTWIEPWISDGTEAGTTLVRDINPGLIGSGITSMVSSGNIEVFASSSGPDGIELWKTDGTEAGTVRLLDIALGPSSSNPSTMQLVGTTLFFLADDGTTGRELHALQLVELTYRVYLPVLAR
jgi:ELWxxDGT repeat protein